MTEHTPGPWSVYEDCTKVAAHGAKHLAKTTYGEYFTESITTDRGEFYNPADARLVAAAPDLYAALQHLMNWLPAFSDEADCLIGARDKYNVAVDMAKAALEKARQK